MNSSLYSLESLDNYMIIRFHINELDLMLSPRMLRELGTRFSSLEDKDLVIDMSRVEYIDSAGLSLIFSIMKDCRERVNSISVICSSYYIKYLFKMFNINFDFQFYSDLNDLLSKGTGEYHHRLILSAV